MLKLVLSEGFNIAILHQVYCALDMSLHYTTSLSTSCLVGTAANVGNPINESFNTRPEGMTRVDNGARKPGYILGREVFVWVVEGWAK